VKLPHGYVERRQGSLRVIARPPELDEMAALLAGPARSLAQHSEGQEDGLGRGATRRFLLPGGGAVYVRKYLRGGMVRHFNRDRYLRRPPRPVRELIVTEQARVAGCSVPAVMAACVEAAGLFYRGWLVTRAIEPALTLFAALDAAPDRQERGAILEAAGVAARSLHSAGVYHPDLTGDNLLVGPGNAVSVIDLDRAFTGRAGSSRLAERGLARLWRSLEKGGGAMADEERRWLERGYRG
ncbi:uncharacterized protein METZ01_LOCUS326139, partial [marine metagenome]